jgi:hypothetical protein
VNIGVRWEPGYHKVEGKNDEPKLTVIYRQVKKAKDVRVGVLQADKRTIIEGGATVGVYQPAGLFTQVAEWMYRQVADVWKIDNEFAARWASYAFGQEHKDLKVVLAAFMLVQSRKGDPVRVGDKIEFYDEDYRDIGEAMMLLYERGANRSFDPKLLLRIRSVLELPAIAAINHELGFGKSAREAFLGRWPKAVQKWLRFREENPKVLEGLVTGKGTWGSSVKELVRAVGYKPATPKFYQTLRWRQHQATDGRRQVAIGETVAAAETWEGLTEEAICQKIMREKPSFFRITSLLPTKLGLTRAIMAAAIEAGVLSDKDLVIKSVTLEELGLLQVQEIRERWQRAVAASEDMRAANIAMRVKSKATQDTLNAGADAALQKAVAEVIKNVRVILMVDVSSSMAPAIEAAKKVLARFVQGFPLDQLHVSTFNTAGKQIKIVHPSAAGVENAFRGVTACGGTVHAEGLRPFRDLKPRPDEDVLFLYVGDEEEQGTFEAAIRQSGLNPVAFGLIKVRNSPGYAAVQNTAARLGIPCFVIDEKTFEDTYAIPRTLRNLIAATPVRAGAVAAPVVQRVTLIDSILKTDLLKKPVWATTSPAAPAGA